MGALVTLELPADSPVLDLPWVVTFGPLGDEGAWEPVVCGPYLRGHALALAQAVVAEEDLMAVVEPVMPLPSVAEIQAEIARAQLGPEESEFDLDDEEGEPVVGAPVEETEPPSRDEVRAGFGRVAALLDSVR